MEKTDKQVMTDFKKVMKSRGYETIILALNPETKKFIAATHIKTENVGFTFFKFILSTDSVDFADKMAQSALAARQRIIDDNTIGGKVDEMLNDLDLK